MLVVVVVVVVVVFVVVVIRMQRHHVGKFVRAEGCSPVCYVDLAAASTDCYVDLDTSTATSTRTKTAIDIHRWHLPLMGLGQPGSSDSTLAACGLLATIWYGTWQ